MYIDEWFSPFYKKLPLGYHNPDKFAAGQIFWTHAYYPHENLLVWRPGPMAGPARTIAADFRAVAPPPDAFKKSLPLDAPKLATDEEFLVLRAKRRPVVLLRPASTLLAVSANTGFKGKVDRHLCLIGQVFGLADPKTGRAEFAVNIVERIRRMEFPELMFLPKSAGLFVVDSMLRLDEVQSAFAAHLEPTQYSLGDDVLEVLRGQLSALLVGPGANIYTQLREELLRD